LQFQLSVDVLYGHHRNFRWQQQLHLLAGRATLSRLTYSSAQFFHELKTVIG
jgi:hypothetical protein